MIFVAGPVKPNTLIINIIPGCITPVRCILHQCACVWSSGVLVSRVSLPDIVCQLVSLITSSTTFTFTIINLIISVYSVYSFKLIS